jgi:hypothetical protein
MGHRKKESPAPGVMEFATPQRRSTRSLADRAGEPGIHMVPIVLDGAPGVDPSRALIVHHEPKKQ